MEPVLTKDFSQIIQDFTENSFKSYEDAENMNLSIIGFEKTEVMKNEVAYHTFMIYKELINNILKHNEECMVKVIWKLKEKTMELFVTNAVNPKSASSRGVGHGRGSTYMKERVNILKGQIKQSMTKDNYSVQISLPC